MSGNQVLNVNVVDVFDYKIARFSLQVLGRQYGVSMLEETAGQLVVAFPGKIPLSIAIELQGARCLLKFVEYPSGADATPEMLSQFFGAPVSADEFARLVAQLRPVARLFTRAQNVEIGANDSEVSVNSAPTVQMLAAA